MDTEMFTITSHQYELIMHQAQAMYPQESGGVLGGREGVILGILPIDNKFLYDRTGTFGMEAEDMERAYKFLEKHQLDFLGIYHSHPKGIPVPSKEDMSHGQKYLFIIGLADRNNPSLYAWHVGAGKHLTQVPVKIVDDKLVEQMFLSPNNPSLAAVAPKGEMEKLGNMISDIVEGKSPYKKKRSTNKWDSSSFSTLA